MAFFDEIGWTAVNQGIAGQILSMSRILASQMRYFPVLLATPIAGFAPASSSLLRLRPRPSASTQRRAFCVLEYGGQHAVNVVESFSHHSTSQSIGKLSYLCHGNTVVVLGTELCVLVQLKP